MKKKRKRKNIKKSTKNLPSSHIKRIAVQIKKRVKARKVRGKLMKNM